MILLKKLMDMTSRRVMITGAAGGLGSVMAHTLSEMGAELILMDLNFKKLEALERELANQRNVSVKLIECDLESEASRLQAILEITKDGQPLNCLINNAAFVGNSDLEGWIAPFTEQTLSTWRKAVEVNLTACFHLSQALSPRMSVSSGANIVNIASIYGEYGPDWRLYEGMEMGNPAAYAATKGALIQLTRWLATTLAPKIRVNAISPGGIRLNQPAEFIKRYSDKTPLRRMGEADDICGAIAYLASDMSKYVTGQIVRVDGGWGQW